MASLPNTVPDLVKMLNKKYPNRCVKPTETLLEAQRYAGSRDVVEFLNSALQVTEDKQRRNTEGIS